MKGDKVQHQIMSDKDPSIAKTEAGSHDSKSGVADASSNCDDQPDSSRATGDESELLGACGGSSRPRTSQVRMVCIITNNFKRYEPICKQLLPLIIIAAHRKR
jgi:hypothetical protein